jgi:glycerol uptake facilitator-like aquaporin
MLACLLAALLTLPLAAQVLVYMTAKVSGGKLNPAVSLGLLVSGSISASPAELSIPCSDSRA